MDLFYNRMQTLLADEYQDFRDALTKPPQKALYVNRLKDGAADIIPASWMPHPLVEDGYYYDETIDHPGKSPYFLAGLYYIQEPSAMLVSSFLDVKEDDYVLDLCGAPGGKSCYVASRLGSQGLLITNDIVTRRAKILSENIERFASRQTIVTSADPRRFSPQLDGFFDK
ncbi:MAG: RNA methyltransferase, partial [bacterium]